MAWTNGPSRTSTTHWKQLRAKAERQLDYRCQHCGSEDNLELDHIVNDARGGTETLDNVQWLCKRCHGRKTQQEASERRGRYRRRTPPPLGTSAHPVRRHPTKNTTQTRVRNLSRKE
ncbi:HNH endonuclease [Corynebacterium sp.]|uniref:HNH endonuclease n=1 Tax=Corynebacterium sp. TaxID=1720 RepID=UPI0037C06902